MFKHVILININNRVVSHQVQEISESECPEDHYIVTYSKNTEMFRVEYCTEDDSRYKVEREVVKTFRSRCSAINNGIFEKSLV